MDPRKVKVKKRFITVLVVLFVVAILSLSFGAYFFYKYKYGSNIEKIKKEESEELFLKISKLYFIPNDEKPAIAVVTDPKAFQNQGFFLDAQEGDVIYMFSINKKAVLYRPDINKIVDIISLSNEDLSSVSSTDNTNGDLYIGSDDIVSGEVEDKL